MNYRALAFILFLYFNSLQAQLKLSNGKLTNKHYTDTIHYQDKFGFICVPVKINDQEKTLIFDTGADLVLLSKDSLTRSGAIKVKLSDSQGNAATSEFETAEKFTVSGLNYSRLLTVKTDLPKTLLCFADGLLGNNLIRKSNWQITDNYLIATDKRFKKDLPFVSVYYYDSNRLFSNMVLNGNRLDSCLIDYGGRFGIELPLKFYSTFTEHVKKINATTKEISVKWGVNGKADPDTITEVNCNIDLIGISIDSVTVTFSKRFKERRLGILILNRFTSVYLDNISQKMFFETPVSTVKEPLYASPISIDLEENNFIVSGKVLNDQTAGIELGHKLRSVNGRLASEFTSYSEFIIWSQKLKRQNNFMIVTMDGRELKLETQK